MRTADSFTQSAIAKEGAVPEACGALLEELLRVERHGFTATELARAKSDVLRSHQRAVQQRETEDAKGFAREIVRNFLQDEAMPGRTSIVASLTMMKPSSFAKASTSSSGESPVSSLPGARHGGRAPRGSQARMGTSRMS